MTNAAQRRFDAIGDVIEYLMSEPWITVKPGMTREEAASKIGELDALGRTHRWKVAIATWQAVVRDESRPLEHAITQWAIFTSHASF